jgi:hypothetical protein
MKHYQYERTMGPVTIFTEGNKNSIFYEMPINIRWKQIRSYTNIKASVSFFATFIQL